MLNLNENTIPVSKAQRRLFVLAYLYKKGKLDDVTVSDSIKEIADTVPEERLREIASTNQKKRKKDGTISKRNALPQRVKK